MIHHQNDVQKAVLYPYNNLESYYNTRPGQNAKLIQKLVRPNNDIFRNTQTLRGGRDMKMFKLSCLKSEQMIYEDKNLCIGVKSYLIKQKETYLKMELYFANKGGAMISDLAFQFFGNERKSK